MTDLKTFRGKVKILVKVPGAPGITRYYRWDDHRKEYRPPAGVKTYYARRWETDELGRKTRVPKYHDTLAEARAWLSGQENEPVADGGPLFGEVLDKFFADHVPTLSQGSDIRYQNLRRLHMGFLEHRPIREITDDTVDDWIKWMRGRVAEHGKASIRTGWLHELRFLTTVLNFYAEVAKDPEFRMPIRRRHRKAVKMKRQRSVAPKDLGLADFDRFAERLEQRFGLATRGLATCQYENPGRISEPAALKWDRVELNFRKPSDSWVTFDRHVLWLRKKGVANRIEPGLKNGEAKRVPMTPRLFDVLQRLRQQPSMTGLVFPGPSGDFFAYSTIQNRYNSVFKELGMPYRSTHVMRHGGTRRTLRETKGDRDIAKAQLGNKSVVDTYAVRDEMVLKEHTDTQWATHIAETMADLPKSFALKDPPKVEPPYGSCLAQNETATLPGGRQWPPGRPSLKLVPRDQ